MHVFSQFESTLKKRPLHVTLIDPDPKKLVNLEYKIKALEKFGTDGFLIGGSTNVSPSFLDETIKKIKSLSTLPVILFPGGTNGISGCADAIFFMSLLNSRDPFFISGIQAKGAPYVKKLGLEAIPMGYIIIEPGMKVGQVGKADLIKRNDLAGAVRYALAAEYFGMKILYVEAGSGAPEPVPTEMIREIKKNVSIPVIVGGGIRKPEQATALLKAGADIIDTGTITEENFSAIEGIIKAVRNFRK